MKELRAKSFTRRRARMLLPRRDSSSHKAKSGKSVIIAGSAGMWGAAILCATAASRVGSGYVTLLTDLKKFPFTTHPDFLGLNLAKTPVSQFSSASVAIGPGLGKSPRLIPLIKRLKKFNASSVVLDADALNALARTPLKSLTPTWILTPHEGELARLLGVSSQEIRRRREYYVQLAQRRLGAVIVLKGHGTLVCSASELIRIDSGNAALAKAGTGDVLTGMICGLLAQGLTSVHAACLATFVHGQTSELWIKDKKDVLSLMASDVLNLIPRALFDLRKTK